MKVLLKRFHLNGITIGFRPQSQKLEPPYDTFIFHSQREGVLTKKAKTSLNNTTDDDDDDNDVEDEDGDDNDNEPDGSSLELSH